MDHIKYINMLMLIHLLINNHLVELQEDEIYLTIYLSYNDSMILLSII